MKTLRLHAPTIRHCPSARRGFTLVELAASMTVMAILMGAMTSAILIAGYAIPDSEDPAVKKTQAMDVVDQIAGELFYATSISEATETAVTFTVADRGHGAAGPETIRYEWSGTPGDPLTRQYNNGTVIEACKDVQSLQLSFSRGVRPLVELPRVLLAVSDDTAPIADETARKSAMEAWGFTVQLLSHWKPATDFDAAASLNDVLYVSYAADSNSLGAIIADFSLGIVNEQMNHYRELGVSSSGTFTYGTELTAVDNTHEITSVFSTGPLSIFGADENFAVTTQAVSAGTRILGTAVGGYDSLLVLDVGGAMIDGGTANSRRVCLPWAGWKTFDFNNVNSDGLTLMQRAIVWAAAPVSYTRVEIVLQPAEDVEPLRTEVQVFNKPRVNAP